MTKIKKEMASEVNLKDESPDNWKFKLERDKRGKIKPTYTNCVDILTNDTRFKGFAFSTLARRVELTGPVPWKRRAGARFWRESDRNALCVMLNKLYAPFRNIIVDAAFTRVAANRRFNPLEVWLNGLPAWDKKPRIDTLLSRCLGAEQSEYTAAVMRKTLLAAVARVYKPGLKFDCVPVLNGPQGIGKSTFWHLLAGNDYFTDSLWLEDMRDKTAAEKIQGIWFAELTGFEEMSEAATKRTRSFITCQSDDYKATYARVAERRPRVTILVGTTADEWGYLKDAGDDCRAWPVVCKGAPEGAEAVWTIEKDRDQIWAEALEMYDELCLDSDALARALEMDTPALQAAALEAQAAALEVDEREGLVEMYLDKPILRPEVWSTLTIDERVRFMRGETHAISGKIDVSSEPRVQRDRVCLPEIYVECFYGKRTSCGQREQAELAQLMKRLAPKWRKSGRLTDFGPYGRDVEYTRSSAREDEIPFYRRG